MKNKKENKLNTPFYWSFYQEQMMEFFFVYVRSFINIYQ